VPDGSTVGLRGQGDYSPAADACGDLLLTVAFAFPPGVSASGMDVSATVPASALQLVTGFSAVVSPCGEPVPVRCEPGADVERPVTLPGLGLAGGDGRPRGSLTLRLVLRGMSAEEVEVARGLCRGAIKPPPDEPEPEPGAVFQWFSP
jgi:DnaJ-class molecular chaperone